jgi:hypothetical protein
MSRREPVGGAREGRLRAEMSQHSLLRAGVLQPAPRRLGLRFFNAHRPRNSTSRVSVRSNASHRLTGSEGLVALGLLKPSSPPRGLDLPPMDRRQAAARRLSRPRRADRRGDGAGASSPPGQPLKRARKALRSCKRRRDRRRNRKTNAPVTASQPTAIIATPMIWLWSGIGRASISGISQRKPCRPGSPAAKRADLIVGCP